MIGIEDDVLFTCEQCGNEVEETYYCHRTNQQLCIDCYEGVMTP